jgi:HlyD family secretion protein
MRILRSWMLAVAIPALIAGIAYAATRRIKPVPVRTVAVERGRVERTVSSTKAGAIRSRREAGLGLETAGRITAIHIREGQAVSAGDPLITIDGREAAEGLRGAQAEMRVLESLLGEMKSRRIDAARTLERIEGLHAEGVASDAQRDDARLQAEAAAAAYAAAAARIESQKVAVARAEIAVDKCRLRAPFDGVVTDLLVEVGEWALPGKLGIRLMDPMRLYIRAEIDEVDIGPVRVGLPARVLLDPYRDRRLEGRVVRVAPCVSEIQEQNRTLEVEVELTAGAEGLDLKPGTSSDVEVILQSDDRALRLPAPALLEGDRVFTIGRDGRAALVSVKIGLRNWEFAQVLEGLAEGEPVIVSLESERLKSGVPVRRAGEDER